jgi:hypothetical protein
MACLPYAQGPLLLLLPLLAQLLLLQVPMLSCAVCLAGLQQ